MLPRGTALGRFVVLGLVGRGAMGEVYGAYDPELDRKIAIKLVRARVDAGGDTAAARARFMREAQATAKISHPNVVIVYDAGTFGERVFIAMEFVEGHTLRYWLQEKERPWREVLDAFLAAGRGLGAAHDKELVHRDFKPDNVMVAATGQVRVMDFGLARVAATTDDEAPAAALVFPASPEPVVDLEATPILTAPKALEAAATATFAMREKITATGALLGTPAYMSPEQFQGRTAGARSDQFSFCVALYEALYGARPFAGRTLEELARNVVDGRLADPPAGRGVPARVRKALARGLRADPDERFGAMQELLAELEQGAGAGQRGFARDAAAKLAGVWEAPVAGHAVETAEKEAIRAAFLATGKAYAAAAFASASATLDRYAQRWTELYVDVCEATHVRGEQSAEILDLRMACLMEGLYDLKALCRLFRAATPDVVENAVRAAAALGTLERVQDVKLLRAVVRPPEDPQTRAAVERLRERLVDLRALGRVGRVAHGLKEAAPLVEEARRVGYEPLLAEVLIACCVLRAEGMTVNDELVAMLEDAIWTAETARHDEIAATAACLLVYVIGYQEGRFDLAEVWARHCEAVLRRMGEGHDRLWAWYFHNRASMREQQGRLDDAIADIRRAVAAKERTFGPESPDLGMSIGNLANHLSCACRFEEALEASRRALEMLMAALGPEHPWTALALMNQGQILNRLSRFADAQPLAERALRVLERETDPRGLAASFALRTLGLALTGLGRTDEAVRTLERAVEIRERLEKKPLRLAEVHSALARALGGRGGKQEEERALALARQARDEYQRVPTTPIVALDVTELERWIAGRAPV